MIMESLHTVDDIETSQATEYELLKSFFKKSVISALKSRWEMYILVS